jgi:hypothetical protein
VARKKAAPIRLGDMVRVMWKAPGKTSAKCLDEAGDGWTCAGIGYPNVCREARAHSRETGHITRIAAIEVIEYRPGRRARTQSRRAG